MKKQYQQGHEVAEKFEKAMKILFRTPKPEIDRKEKRTPRKSSVRKTKHSDKG
jgi:hypothetical protein